MYIPNSRWSWAFIIIAAVQAAIVLAFESYVFANFQLDLLPSATTQTPSKTIPTFLTLYIFGFVFQLILVYDALSHKNTIQIIGLVLYNVGLLIYGAVQMEQINDAINALAAETNIKENIWPEEKPFLIAIPCVLALGTFLLAIAAWKLYGEFAWTIFKHISADLKMRRRYLTFQIYIALLKFDFFFFLGFTVQFVVIVTQKTTEFALTVAAIPMTIIILLLADYWTRRESLPGVVGIIVLYFGGLGYFLFKMVRMYSPSHGHFYTAARKELTTFAVITIILIILTIVNACLCAMNFNKGLKPYVVRRKRTQDEEKPWNPTDRVDPNRRPPERMMIE